MYKHKIIMTNGKEIEWTNNQDKVLPCYFGVEGCMFFYYQISDLDEANMFTIPAAQVVCIHTIKVGG